MDDDDSMSDSSDGEVIAQTPGGMGIPGAGAGDLYVPRVTPQYKQTRVPSTQLTLPPAFSATPVPAPARRAPSIVLNEAAGMEFEGVAAAGGGGAAGAEEQMPYFKLGGLSIGGGRGDGGGGAGGGEGDASGGGAGTGDGGAGAVNRFSVGSIGKLSGGFGGPFGFGNGRLSGLMGSGMRLSGSLGVGALGNVNPADLLASLDEDGGEQLQYYRAPPARLSGRMSDGPGNAALPAASRDSIPVAPLYLGEACTNPVSSGQFGALGARNSLNGVSPLGFGFAAPIAAPQPPGTPGALGTPAALGAGLPDPLGGTGILENIAFDQPSLPPNR